MEPVGFLPYVVGGIKTEENDGPSLLQIMSYEADDPVGAKRYERPSGMELIELSEAFLVASLHPFDTDPRLRTPLRLGMQPLVPEWFPAWRWAHEMVGDPAVRRISVYFWSMRENPTGASLRSTKNRALYVDGTQRLV